MLPPVNHLRTSKGNYLFYCNQSYKTEVSQVIIKNIQWQISSIIRWLHEIDQNCDVVNRILVGNKNDDPDRKVVLSEDARRFAHQMGIQVLKTAIVSALKKSFWFKRFNSYWIFWNNELNIISYYSFLKRLPEKILM